MASTASVDKFVKTILQLWPPYRWEDGQEQNWIELVAVKISGFSDQVLERALSEMVGKRDDRRTPLPAECIAACNEARRWIDAENGQRSIPTLSGDDGLMFKHPEWADSRINLANDLVCGKMGSGAIGKQAAKDFFWILQLHDFCRINKRLPSEKEIASLKRAGQETDEAFARFSRGHGPIAERGAWAIEVVTEKRRRLAEMVIGG